MIRWFKFRIFKQPHEGFTYHPSECPHFHDVQPNDYRCVGCGAWVGELSDIGGPSPAIIDNPRGLFLDTPIVRQPRRLKSRPIRRYDP